MAYPRETKAYCASCKTVVPATVREAEGSLFMEANCPVCEPWRTIIEHDAKLYAGWERERRPNTPPEQTQRTSTTKVARSIAAYALIIGKKAASPCWR